MFAADITVTRTEEYMRPTLLGPPEKVMRVYFMVGEHGPFSEDFKRAEYTPEQVGARIEETATTTRALAALRRAT